MSGPFRVLISAYACEPGKGSEPEVGWQWAMQMAQRHRVTVLTRANNQSGIERALANCPAEVSRPEFVYHDCPEWQLRAKRWMGVQLYYVLWQRSARRVVARLHASSPFDVMHHVTFAAFRYPTAIWGHGAASVWGPVGGVELVPMGLLPWGHPRALASEALRDAHNALHARFSRAFARRLSHSTVTLASTYDMQRAARGRGVETRVMPTIGIHASETRHARGQRSSGPPLRLLFVGNMLTLKGIDLALEALHKCGCDVALTLVGDGPMVGPWTAMAARLGMSGRVKFFGRLPRDQVLRMYGHFDVFLFPALHDTGGYVVIEAMVNSLPVICLDTGGPSVSVKHGCGVKVPVGSRSAIVEGLAQAISRYAKSPETIAHDGENARREVIREYDWSSKADAMSAIYAEAVDLFRSRVRIGPHRS